MRTIRIVADGVPIEIFDDTNKPLEEVTLEIANVLKNNKVATIIGKNSSIVVRPSSVSAINILDENEKPISRVSQIIKKQSEPQKNREQKSEPVDMIVDLQS